VGVAGYYLRIFFRDVGFPDRWRYYFPKVCDSEHTSIIFCFSLELHFCTRCSCIHDTDIILVYIFQDLSRLLGPGNIDRLNVGYGRIVHSSSEVGDMKQTTGIVVNL